MITFWQSCYPREVEPVALPPTLVELEEMERLALMDSPELDDFEDF